MLYRLYKAYKKLVPGIEHIRGTTWLYSVLRNKTLRKKLDKNGCYPTKLGPIKFNSISDYRPILEEEAFFQQFTAHIKKDSVIYDIGGFHGFYAIVGSLGKLCYCFEPDTENLKHLKENIQLNKDNFPNRDIQIIKKAVWSEEKSLHFHYGHSGKSSVIGKDSGDSVAVESVSIDNFTEEHEKPDLIKIDVEGAEARVLKGAKSTLKRFHPKLFLEIHDEAKLNTFGNSSREIEQLLQEVGYYIQVEISRGYEKQVICQGVTS